MKRTEGTLSVSTGRVRQTGREHGTEGWRGEVRSGLLFLCDCIQSGVAGAVLYEQ